MWGTILVGVVFAGIFAAAFRKVYLDAKNKKCSCGSSCSSKSKCHMKQ